MERTWRQSIRKPFIKKVAPYLLIMAAVFGSLYWLLLAPVSLFDSSTYLIQVEGGQNLSEIAQNLKDKKLIKSTIIFRTMAKLWQMDTKIHPGRFPISKKMNIKEILNTLTDAKRGEIAITIPEGFSIYDIDERLAGKGLILPGEFSSQAALLEGYLFPDTYFIYNINFDPQDLIKKMQNNFLKKLTPDLTDAIKKQNRTIEDVIKMASIVEKEVRTEKDYALVAGILWKRLEAKWALQTDATLLYGKSTSVITSSDLKADSPYNTRKIKGLPPTAICNPGLAAIRSTIFSKESSYWFYLTDKDGNVHYSETNDEHNQNKLRYIN
ncbi:MAG: endolytic transglycosylase MltG [Candidatus Gracilibacteria bacterium]|jgi:UPF0755 protein